MPGRDRTGPEGAGPLTGGGFGPCAGYDVAGPVGAPVGRAMGRGGWGRGWRHRRVYLATGLPRWARRGARADWDVAPAYGPYAGPVTREQQAQVLQRQADALRQQLANLEESLAALSQEPETDE